MLYVLPSLWKSCSRKLSNTINKLMGMSLIQTYNFPLLNFGGKVISCTLQIVHLRIESVSVDYGKTYDVKVQGYEMQ